MDLVGLEQWTYLYGIIKNLRVKFDSVYINH